MYFSYLHTFKYIKLHLNWFPNDLTICLLEIQNLLKHILIHFCSLKEIGYISSKNRIIYKGEIKIKNRQNIMDK